MKYQANPVIVDAFKIVETTEMDNEGNMQIKLDGGYTGLTTADGYLIIGKELTARMCPLEDDYYVIQSDGYAYLNPKDVFERKYSPINNQPPCDNAHVAEGCEKFDE